MGKFGVVVRRDTLLRYYNPCFINNKRPLHFSPFIMHRERIFWDHHISLGAGAREIGFREGNCTNSSPAQNSTDIVSCPPLSLSLRHGLALFLLSFPLYFWGFLSFIQKAKQASSLRFFWPGSPDFFAFCCLVHRNYFGFFLLSFLFLRGRCVVRLGLRRFAGLFFFALLCLHAYVFWHC